ncbi:MAG: hypothetical protein GWN87_32065, partial [Desulfuromonadales bacterium]|nr:hypothetical protein [Desulfuromonadales bacterium]
MSITEKPDFSAPPGNSSTNCTRRAAWIFRLTMAWRKLEATFHGNPKSKRLARRLEIGRATARGLISGLWSWALLHAPDGDLVGFDGEDIAEAVDFDGDADDLIRALVEVRVLDREGDRLSIHNWLERGGSYAEKVRKRLERQRQSSKNVQDSLGQTKTVQDEKGQSENVEDRPKMSGTKTDSPGPSENVAVRREEKRREENILPSAVTVSSTSLLARADDAPQQKDR